jgi:predicted nuclease of predicted toxin-antitoxin system
MASPPQTDVDHAPFPEVGLSGAVAEKVFAWAQQHQAVIVTFDEDFADQRSFPLGEHYGIIRLRIWPTTIEET